MMRKTILGALLLLALAASPAAAQYAPTVISPNTVTPGGSVTISGQACTPNQVVVVTMQLTDKSAAAFQVATGKADDKGNYTITFVVPANTPLGKYTVRTDCGTGVDGLALTVVAANTATTQPGTGSGTGTKPPASRSSTLARTGTNLDRMGLAGAGLLLAGGFLLVATKRRRHASAMAA